MAKYLKIITNAKIRTMAPDLPEAEAMAILPDGRIGAVGTNEKIRSMNKSGAQEIDLAGQTVIPGFFDCHLHMQWLGTNLGNVDLSSPPVSGVEDIIRLMQERIKVDPESICIQGNRYDQNKFSVPEHPDRNDLDRVSKDVAVRIVHTSGHAAVVNSAALRKLGIDRNTPNPVGGEIVRDASGEPTGLLLETASWNNLDKILPELSREENLASLARANRYMLQMGITSASDANTLPGDIELFKHAKLAGDLTVRTNLMVSWAEIASQYENYVPTPADLQPEGANWHELHVGQAKLFSDGAITTRTCWLTEAFVGLPDNYGIPIHPPEELQELIISAHNAGWQIATHAIGDRAVDLVLRCYAEAQRQKTRHKPGHRIEHCMLLNRDLITRLRRQNVWSIGQPEFISALGDAYITGLGQERAFRLSPYAGLEAFDVAQAFSSDCPVVSGSPLAGIRAAVERKTPNGVVLNKEECLSVESAVYAYTAAPAYATGTQRDRGSLETGKFADFTVLSADPMVDGGPDWDELHVTATFIGGSCQYDSQA